MDEKKEIKPEVAGAAVVGFISGVAVGRYLLDEILGDEELRDLKTKGKTIVYRCPKCNHELSVGENYCSNCGVALEWHKKTG
jgi:hypothetical protein